MKKAFALILIIFGLHCKGQSYELTVNFNQALILPSQLVIKDGALSFHIRLNEDSNLTEAEEIPIPDFQLQKFNRFLKDYRFTVQDYSIPPGFCADIIDGDTIITSHKMHLSMHPTKVGGKYILNDSVQLFEFIDPHPKSKDTRFVREIFDLIFEGVDNPDYLKELFGPFDEGLNYYQGDSTTICVYGEFNVGKKQLVEIVDFYNLLDATTGNTVFIDFRRVYQTFGTKDDRTIFFAQLNRNNKNIIVLNPTEDIEKIIMESGFDNLVD